MVRSALTRLSRHGLGYRGQTPNFPGRDTALAQLAQQLAVLVFLHKLREARRAHETQAAGDAGVVIGPDLIVAAARHLLPLPGRPLDLDVRDGGLEDEPDDRLLGPHRIREARMTAQHLPAVLERPGRQFVLVHVPCSLLPSLHTGGGGWDASPHQVRGRLWALAFAGESRLGRGIGYGRLVGCLDDEAAARA